MKMGERNSKGKCIFNTCIKLKLLINWFNHNRNFASFNYAYSQRHCYDLNYYDRFILHTLFDYTIDAVRIKPKQRRGKQDRFMI